ncbi:MAG: hypothetical protein KDA32_11805 [Phycisphaerales bacterium]|nr:hypothetical protein [Phycisphaerales bacterium]
MTASINLVPVPFQRRQCRQRRRRAWGMVVCGLGALLGAAWLGERFWPDHARPLREHTATLKQRYSETRLELARATAERDAALERARVMLGMQARANWAEVLIAICQAIPAGVVLTASEGMNVGQSGDSDGSGLSVTLRGMCLGHAALAEFADALRRAETIARVEPGNVARAPVGGDEALSFELTLWAGGANQ